MLSLYLMPWWVLPESHARGLENYTQIHNHMEKKDKLVACGGTGE